jgi:ATP-dependent Clp endopeptidase proteolytic subunit ClpP
MKTFYNFANAASPDVAQLSIFDEIGFWGTNAKDFYTTIKGITAPRLDVDINSPGGSVVDGYAIYNMLKHTYKGEVHVRVMGIAASIASVIAMAGKTISMPANALMFIHDPLVFSGGNAEELRKQAEDLDKMKEGILSIYEARTGSDRAKISQMMTAETLMTAQEAKDNGFADTILEETKAEAKFNVKDLFTKDVSDRIRVLDTKDNFHLGTPSGGEQKPKTKDNDMSFKTLEEAQAHITSLEASNKTAATDALAAAKTAETNRKTGLKAVYDKHNLKGDLDESYHAAIAGDTTVEAYKDQVLDLVGKRVTKEAIKPEDAVDGSDFTKAYKACKTRAEKQALLKKFPQEARALARAK